MGDLHDSDPSPECGVTMPDVMIDVAPLDAGIALPPPILGPASRGSSGNKPINLDANHYIRIMMRRIARRMLEDSLGADSEPRHTSHRPPLPPTQYCSVSAAGLEEARRMEADARNHFDASEGGRVFVGMSRKSRRRASSVSSSGAAHSKASQRSWEQEDKFDEVLGHIREHLDQHRLFFKRERLKLVVMRRHGYASLQAIENELGKFSENLSEREDFGRLKWEPPDPAFMSMDSVDGSNISVDTSEISVEYLRCRGSKPNSLSF